MVIIQKISDEDSFMKIFIRGPKIFKIIGILNQHQTTVTGNSWFKPFLFILTNQGQYSQRI